MSNLSDIEFARLFQAHFPALTFYARQWTEEAQDVVQEAFMKLAAQHPPPDRPVAWLYHVVRNLSLNAARGANRRQNHLQQWAITQAARAQTASEPSLPRHSIGWTTEEVIATLSQMDDAVQEIVVARIWGGLSFQEISQLVGKSLPTCHRHYQQALQTIKQRLEDPVSSPRKT